MRKPNVLQVTKNSKGRFEYRLLASNGRPLMASARDYGRKDAAIRAAESVAERNINIEVLA